MFVEIAQESCVDLLPIILHGLGVVIRDEEVTVREAAQECTRALARFVNSKTLFELLLPRARGQTAGGDTASHRKLTATRLHICVLLLCIIVVVMLCVVVVVVHQVSLRFDC